MEYNDIILKSISENLNKRGFLISKEEIIPSLGWMFNILAEKNDEVIAIDLRRDDNLSDVFIEKIKNFKGYMKKLSIYLVFVKNPKSSTVTLLSEMGIGIIIFQIRENKIYYLLESKDFSKKPIKKKPKKIITKPMHQIWIFPSSKQWEPDKKKICKERGIVCKVVHDFSRKNHIPIDVHLVENDNKDGAKFKRKILKHLNDSHIFIAALKENWSEYVEFEIKNAFKIISNKDLIIIFKKNMASTEIEKKQISLIKYIEKKGIVHIPYSSLKDFEDKIFDNLMKMISFLYKKNKSKSPFEF